jgi:hypothetical protein
MLRCAVPDSDEAAGHQLDPRLQLDFVEAVEAALIMFEAATLTFAEAAEEG